MKKRIEKEKIKKEKKEKNKDMEIVIIKFILILSIINLIFFGIDKIAAIKKFSRISEATLLILSILGGAIGGCIAMIFFHHKTSVKKFNSFVPLIATIQLLILIILIFSI